MEMDEVEEHTFEHEAEKTYYGGKHGHRICSIMDSHQPAIS